MRCEYAGCRLVVTAARAYVAWWHDWTVLACSPDHLRLAVQQRATLLYEAQRPPGHGSPERPRSRYRSRGAGPDLGGIFRNPGPPDRTQGDRLDAAAFALRTMPVVNDPDGWWGVSGV